MTIKKCHSKSNSFVATAEQVCLQPVLEHRQRRGRRNIAWQAITHLCSSNRKGTTSDSWPTTGRNVKLFSGSGPEPASVSLFSSYTILFNWYCILHPLLFKLKWFYYLDHSKNTWLMDWLKFIDTPLRVSERRLYSSGGGRVCSGRYVSRGGGWVFNGTLRAVEC